MTRLDPAGLLQFNRRYRFAGGRVRKVRLFPGLGGKTIVEVVLSIRTALRDLGTEPVPVRLKLRFTSVEEFRFQKRPTMPAGRIPDARLGYFDGLFFLNLDAFGLSPGDVPKPLDYRASDAYIAAGELTWAEIPKKGK